MTRHVVLQSPSVNRRQPLLNPHPHAASPATRFAEVAGGAAAECAGGAAAECAAVCCCCPCVVAGLLVLAIYRLPAGLCRRVLRQRRRRRRRHSKQGKGGKCGCGCGEHEHKMGPVKAVEELLEMRAVEESPEMEELEAEMWENFYSTGFWRSRSQTQRDFN